jgi:ASPIC/UnbV protein/VCBS repeat protein/FG-GAP repeat protein
MKLKTNLIGVLPKAKFIFLLWLTVSFIPTYSLAQNNFIDVSEAQNISRENFNGSFNGGVSFVDVDGDGWDDITFASREGKKIEFYRNNQGVFQKEALNIDNTCDSKQVIWVDFDNDGDKDLFYTCKISENMVLYENDGQMNFTDVAMEKGLETVTTALVYAATWLDFDRDGFLDLYVGYYSSFRPNQLFRNIDGNSFEEITTSAIPTPGKKLTFALQAIDFDNDGWEDIYTASDRDTENELLQNNEGKSFIDQGESSLTNIPMDGMGVTTLDMNNDGFLEVYISNSEAGNVLLFNNGDGTFQDIAEQSGTLFSSFAWGVNTLDIDNDSKSDLYVSGSNEGTEFLSSALYRAIDEEHFVQTQYEGMKGDTLRSFSNAVGDFNNDGKMDIVVGNADFYDNQLWQNTSETSNNWLQVKLEGTFSNRDALGSKVVLYSEDLVLHQYLYSGTSFLSQNAGYIHFGLKDKNQIDSVVVSWPSGLIDVIKSPAVNQKIFVIEGRNFRPVKLTSTRNLDNTFCEGENIELSFELYGRGISTVWSDQSEGNEVIISQNGTYFASITSGNTTITSEVIDLTFEPIPVVTIEVTQIIGDELGAVSITGASDYEYKWSHDFNLNSGNLTDLEGGTYSVVIVNAAGCAIVESFVIDVVTGIEEAIIKDITYKLEGNDLLISIPNAIQHKLQGWQVFNSNGSKIGSSEKIISNSSEIQVPHISRNQLILVNLIFNDDRVVKKLIFID